MGFILFLIVKNMGKIIFPFSFVIASFIIDKYAYLLRSIMPFFQVGNFTDKAMGYGLTYICTLFAAYLFSYLILGNYKFLLEKHSLNNKVKLGVKFFSYIWHVGQ